MQNKKVSKHYNKIAKHYEQDYNEPIWNLYNDITWYNIKQHLPKNKLILDAGGGTGLWSRKLAKLNYQVICTDISSKMLSTGKKLAKKEKIKIKFKKSDICNMHQFKANTFNLVLAQGDVVSYCENPEKAIKELKRVAKKNAKIIISIDNFYSAIQRLLLHNKQDQIPNLLQTQKTDILNLFSQHNFKIKEIKQLLKKHNLKLISLTGKPVLINKGSHRKINEFLQNKNNYKTALDLELKFNKTPELLGSAGHLEIVCQK